jgi:hypothetical protein
MIKIIDNFLNKDQYDELHNAMFSADFPWYYANSVLPENLATCKKFDNYQWAHSFYREYSFQSQHAIILLPIIKKLDPAAIVRIKGLMLSRTEENVEHGMHEDNTFNTTNALYYLNTNNGYTRFANGKKVDSIANRMVVFSSGIKHTGATCTDQKVRCAINFNYYCK